MSKSLLNFILDEEFLQTLAKSAELYKIGTNSALDPEEIRIGLKVVPRAVMSLLISELSPMEINSSKDIDLPFGQSALIRVNKNAADDYTGSVYNDNKLVYDFKNRSIPGLGIILLSTFELYDLEDLSNDKIKPSEPTEKKIQKLIDEKLELHSLVNRVVENKMAEREAIHKLMMAKLTEALQKEDEKNRQIAEVRQMQERSTPQSDEYFRGMTNGLEVANSIANEKEPNFIESKKDLNIEAKDIAKKEAPTRKGSPLKEFLERKKSKTTPSYHVEISKSEQVSCPDCGQVVFGNGSFAACICFGADQYKKIWLKKSENGIELKFSKNWDYENTQMLLEILRAKK